MLLAAIAIALSGAALVLSGIALAKVRVMRHGIEIMRLTNLGNVVSDQVATVPDEEIITLSDNEGNMKLSVRQRSIFLIESDDNYIKVWYEDHAGDMRQYMLRCRLKTVEASFSDSDLVRCHRKYIINISKVQVLRRDRDSYVVELDGGPFPDIPVSKTYEANVLSRFNSR